MARDKNFAINRSIDNLYPAFALRVGDLIEALNTHVLEHPTFGKYRFEMFEGYRSPMRQHQLNLDTDKVTKAGAWQSAHQYGLAADFAGRSIDKRDWTWAKDLQWEFLKREAERVGLAVPIVWDRGHVMHPGFNAIRAAYKAIR